MARRFKIKVLPHGEGLPLPSYQTIGSAGADVAAAESWMIRPGECRKIPTGLCFEIPPGFEIQVRPRSGLSIGHRLIIPNAPGTIDSDYRGELFVALLNLGTDGYRVERGHRIAQLVVAPVVQATWQVVTELSDTERGSGGCGSTGT